MLSIEKQILHLIDIGQEVSSRELLTIYTKRDYHPNHIRNLLSKLKKQGFIISEKRGYYRISETGRQLLLVINSKADHYHLQHDHHWFLCFFHFPESERLKRDRFRNILQDYGFGRFKKSLYICAWDYSQAIQKTIKDLEITDYVTFFAGQFLGEGPTADHAGEIWQLDRIAGLYLESLAWFENDFLKEELDNRDETSLFIRYLQLGEKISQLFIVDPILPQDLLPADWVGDAVLNRLFAVHDDLKKRLAKTQDYAKFVT